MNADWILTNVSVGTDEAEHRLLLQDVNSCFKSGEITLLIGHNGAGKSTLLETIAGVRELADGEIKLGNESLWVQKGRRSRRKVNRQVILKLGIAMQQSQSQWFASTVRDEMLYSMKPYGFNGIDLDKRIEEALMKTGLDKELLERDPWSLSGGEQRRLSLACLLACEPDWLLLDEPTAGLDAAGIKSLCAVLDAHRAAGRGAVVATHDLDALLPLADKIAVVSGGLVREAAPAAALTHAAAAPQALRVLAQLRAAAALPPEAPSRSGAPSPWPAPRETAAALAAALARGPARERTGAGGASSARAEPALERAAVTPAAHTPYANSTTVTPAAHTPYENSTAVTSVACTPYANSSAVTSAAHTPYANSTTVTPAAHTAYANSTDVTLPAHTPSASALLPAAEPPVQALYAATAPKKAATFVMPIRLRSDRYDPRALVLSYLALTAGVLAQNTLLGLAVTACITALLVAPFFTLIKPWLGVIRGFAIFTLILCLIGGLSINPFEFNWEMALPTAVRLSELMIIMVLGMPLLKLMTPLRLQRAVEQTFGWMNRLRIPIHSFGLLITLIFRFIPLLLEEWKRFAKLAHARGKSTAPLRAIPVKMLSSTAIPYIRSILRLAEQMADAMEARGIGAARQKPTYGFRLRFGAADAKIFTISALGSGMLFLISVFF